MNIKDDFILSQINEGYLVGGSVRDALMGKSFVDRDIAIKGAEDFAKNLAEKFNADTVVNLSNIEKVYTDDPRKNPNAKPLDEISWEDFRKMVGDEWVPGKNCPFDPIASKKAQELKLTVICAGGKNIKNTLAILEGKPYIGTTIK